MFILQIYPYIYNKSLPLNMNTFTHNNIDDWLLLPENEDNHEESDFFEDLIDEIIFEEDFEIPNPVLKLKKKREVNSHFNVDKTKTIWYIHYLLYPKLDNRKFLALFRRRFRMPYDSFARCCKRPSSTS